MTDNRYTQGFDGTIRDVFFNIEDEAIHFGNEAVNGENVYAS